MPTPHPDTETEDEFVERCIPVVLDDGTTDDGDQAAAICHSMYQDAAKAKARPLHLEHKNLPLQIKDIGEREFHGHAAIFGNVDLGGDIILEGAFKKSLASHKRNSTWPPMFWMHHPDQVPGVWKSIEEDDIGLAVHGELVETELGNDTRILLQKKAVRGLSVGYYAVDRDWDKEGNRLLKTLDLWESSIVSLAMNPKARVALVKARLSETGEYVPTERELEGDLIKVGYSRSAARGVIAALKASADSGMLSRGQWDAGPADEDHDPEGVLKEAEEAIGKILRDVFTPTLHH